MDDEEKDNFSDELIFLFFANFTSNERNIIGILRHFEYLIADMFINHTLGRQSLTFDDSNLMINKLIKSYIKKTENREYLRLLFNKIL